MRKRGLALIILLVLSAMIPFAFSNTSYLIESVPGASQVFLGMHKSNVAIDVNGVMWVAYVNDSTNWYFAIEYSLDDGKTWANTPSLGDIETYGGIAWNYDMKYDGEYLHIVIETIIGANNYDTMYRRGLPNPDGTITWSAAWQLIHDGTATNHLQNIIIDITPNGYVYMGAAWHDGAEEGRGRAWKNANNDGTWSTAGGFPVTLGAESYPGFTLMPNCLSDESVWFIWTLDESGDLTIRGKYYDGAWGDETSVSSGVNAEQYKVTSEVDLSDDYVYVMWVTNAGDLPKISWRNGSAPPATTFSTFSLTTGTDDFDITASNGILYIAWSVFSTNKIYYEKVNIHTATEGDSIEVYTETENIEDSPSIALWNFTTPWILTDEAVVGDYLPIWYMTSGSRNVKFVANEGSSGFSLTGVDGWLLVDYKQYPFKVTYVVPEGKTGDFFGMRFSDGYGQVTYWYDWISMTWAAEGSAWQRLPFTPGSVYRSGQEYEVTWNIRITEKAFDAYNVDVYYNYNATDATTSGWIRVKADAFHIYVVGGLNFLEHSGWAGQQGDGFSPWEIYAADSRTPILVDLENFDVGNQGPFKSEYDEGQLSGELDERGWLMYFSRWEETVGHVIKAYPTHNFWGLAGVPIAAESYNSYPYGMRIIDEDTTANRNFYMEKNFRRVMTASDNELVYVQIWMMNPANTKGGEVRILDQSFKQYGAAYMAVQIQFDAAGDLDIYNRGSTNWEKIIDVVNFQWYNITMILNVTAKTVDIYSDGVLKKPGIVFTDAECVEVGTIWIGRANSVVSANDFYVDDVFIYTDWQHNYGGAVRTSAIYKDLQSFSAVIGLGMGEPNIADTDVIDELPNEGHWNIGFDTLFNEESDWVENMLNANITLVGIVSKDKTRYAKLNITWMARGEIIKTDTIYSFWGGYGEIGIDVDLTKIWVDIWYNRLNASTVIEGRITAFEYGMTDTSNVFAQYVFGRSWKEVSESTVSFCVTPIIDESSNLRSSREIALTRVFMEVFRSDNYEFHYRIKITDPLRFGQTGGLMMGIDGIDMRTTHYPKLPRGGLGGFVSSQITLLGRFLTKSVTGIALSAITAVGSKLDWALQYFFNEPNLFTNILTAAWLVISNIGPLISASITALIFALQFLPAAWGLFTALWSQGTGFLSWFSPTIASNWKWVVEICRWTNAWMFGLDYTSPLYGARYDFSNMTGLVIGGLPAGRGVFGLILYGYMIIWIPLSFLSGVYATENQMDVMYNEALGPIRLFVKILSLSKYIFMIPFNVIKWVRTVFGP